jgi:UDP-N-acetylglucosamine 2-epimerase (non-hydrolysing)
MKSSKDKKICFIIGTRPEIIKMSPLIHECLRRKISFFIIHTNQHYSKYLSSIFFEELKLPIPKYNLKIKYEGHGHQTGSMIIEIEKILIKETPSIVLVQGDTNTVLAGALSAAKLNIKIGHIEAGLRSNDKLMPEETNRIIVDHLSDHLFVPTKDSLQNLSKEGIGANKAFVVGNTVADAIKRNLKYAGKSRILVNLDIASKKYFLATVHRQENVDNEKRLRSIIDGLMRIGERHKMKVIFPIHPRANKMVKNFHIKLNDFIMHIEPLGYLDFLHLSNNARLILTDSGGIQEEASIMKVRCVTLRDNTERPETLKGGGNSIVGVLSKSIVQEVEKIMSGEEEVKWGELFGKGNISGKIMDIIIKHI